MFVRGNIDGLDLTEVELEKLNTEVYSRCREIREDNYKTDEEYRAAIRKVHAEVLEEHKKVRGRIETNKIEAIKMNLHNLSIIVDEAQAMHPKLDGNIKVISRGSKSLSICFYPRHDIEDLEPDICGTPYDQGIYFDVLNLTSAEVKELINNYRIYRNFGMSDYQKQYHGV